MATATATGVEPKSLSERVNFNEGVKQINVGTREAEMTMDDDCQKFIAALSEIFLHRLVKDTVKLLPKDQKEVRYNDLLNIIAENENYAFVQYAIRPRISFTEAKKRRSKEILNRRVTINAFPQIFLTSPLRYSPIPHEE